MALGLGSDFRFDIFARDRTGPAWRGVETSMQRTQRAAAGLLRTMGPLIGVAGGAVAASAFTDMARRSLEFADALVTAADRTSFAVDELERLRFAGFQNRIEFNQTDMALQRFSRRLAEAASGTGELRQIIEDQGIALRDVNGNMRSSYDILLDYADAVANAESGQEQLRMAFKAFDSEGAAWVNVLREGREGLIEYGDAADAAGAIMGERLARNAAEANRRLREMQQTLQGQFNAAIAENADDLADFAEAMASLVRWTIQAVAKLGELYDIMRRSRGGRIGLDPESVEEAENLIDQATSVRNMLRDMESGTRLGQQGYSRIVGVLGTEMLAAEGVTIGARSRLDPTELFTLAELINLRIQTLEDARDALNGDGDGNGDNDAPPGTSVWEGAMSGADMAALGPTPRFSPRSSAVQQEWMEAMEAFTSLKAEQFASDAVKAELDEYQAHRGEFSRATGAFFADGVMAAFDGNLQEYLRQRIRQSAYDGLYEAFTDAAGYLLDLLRNSGDGGSAGSWVSSAANWLFGGGKASGGPAQPGMVYRVGERGPEDVVFGAPAHVLTADQTAGRGTTIVEQHFHLHADNAVMTEDLLTQFEGKANAAAGRAVAPVVGAARRSAKRTAYGLKK